VLFFLVLAFACGIAQARFRQPNEEYQARRAKLRAAVDGPVVIFGHTGHEDTSEVAVFYQEPYFYYLTGHDEPGAAVLMIPEPPSSKSFEGPREILFLPPRDPAQEVWDGPKLGPDDPDVAEKTGFQAVETFADLKPELAKLAKTYQNFYTLFPQGHEDGYPHFTESTAWVRDAVPHSDVKDVTAVRPTAPLGVSASRRAAGRAPTWVWDPE
jgi:Xaa-Pro aminopeptidase